MKYLPTFGFVTLSLCFCFTTFAQQELLEFDSNQQEPLLEYDMTGGFRMRPPEGFVAEPRVRVYADGTVHAGQTNPSVMGGKTKINSEELKNLLSYIVLRKKIQECDTQKIEADIRATGDTTQLADAPTSKFSVRLKNLKHDVDIYALGFVQRRYPDIPAVGRLASIEKRLNQVAAVALIGSQETVEDVLKKINAQIRSKHPGFTPMKSSNLQFASKKKNGSLYISFHKNYYGSDKRLKSRCHASFSQKNPQDPGKVKISFMDTKSNR